jgi:hypothetical protein
MGLQFAKPQVVLLYFTAAISYRTSEFSVSCTDQPLFTPSLPSQPNEADGFPLWVHPYHHRAGHDHHGAQALAASDPGPHVGRALSEGSGGRGVGQQRGPRLEQQLQQLLLLTTHHLLLVDTRW